MEYAVAQAEYKQGVMCLWAANPYALSMIFFIILNGIFTVTLKAHRKVPRYTIKMKYLNNKSSEEEDTQ